MRSMHAGNSGGDRMAHGWGGVGGFVLCADCEGEEMVMGDDLGSCRAFLMDTASDFGEFVVAAGLWRLLCVDGRGNPLEGGGFRRDVGHRQCELWADDAAP